jgi:chaperonin GroES
MRNFRPLGDRLLVRPDAPPEKKTTGLAEPPSQKEQPTEGIVEAVGPDVDYMDGVEVGFRVQYTKYAGRDVMHNGVKHKLLRLEEVEGRIEEAGE